MTDWLGHLKNHAQIAGEEFDLDSLRPGDILVVETLHTAYRFRIVGDRLADLETGRSDRPCGRVQIQGCTFGDSSTIKPERLFCGGNLEFTYDDGKMVQRTTSIQAIRHTRKMLG